MFNGVGQNDVYGDMKHDVLSIENNDDLIHDYDRWKNWPHGIPRLNYNNFNIASK